MVPVKTGDNSHSNSAFNQWDSHSNFGNNTKDIRAPSTMLTSSTWVKNLSSTPITEAQECLLAHGPNFAIVPKCPFNGEYIMVVEHACSKLSHRESEKLRVEVKNVLKKVQLPKIITKKKEIKVIKELKQDDTRKI